MPSHVQHCESTFSAHELCEWKNNICFARNALNSRIRRCRNSQIFQGRNSQIRSLLHQPGEAASNAAGEGASKGAQKVGEGKVEGEEGW